MFPGHHNREDIGDPVLTATVQNIQTHINAVTGMSADEFASAIKAVTEATAQDAMLAVQPDIYARHGRPVKHAGFLRMRRLPQVAA
jgi:hypothetical protein